MSKLKAMYARSAVPLHIQIASALRQRIESGHWQPGQEISTLEALECEFEVARVRVRLAIELLKSAGTAIYVADTTYRNDCVKLYIDLFRRSPPDAAIPKNKAALNAKRPRKARARRLTH